MLNEKNVRKQFLLSHWPRQGFLGFPGCAGDVSVVNQAIPGSRVVRQAGARDGRLMLQQQEYFSACHRLGVNGDVLIRVPHEEVRLLSRRSTGAHTDSQIWRFNFWIRDRFDGGFSP